MMQEIRSVLFDIGNVFVPWDPRRLYEKLIPNKDELDTFLTQVVTTDWHAEHDRGRPFAEGVALLSRWFPDHADLIQQFDSRWEETIGPAFTDTIQILERLVAKGIPCYALTNFSAEKFPAFRRQNPFTDLFDGIVVSGEEKLIKPDPRLFEVTLERFSLRAQETLFIDDRLVNVLSAEQMQMTGHVFVNADRLRAHLTDLGLL